MGELPTWWKWVPAEGAFDVPLGSISAVYDDDGEWVATLEWLLSTRCKNGVWAFRLSVDGGSFESRDYDDKEEARRACERVYVAVMGALGEVVR